jgi:shikimate kinase
MVKLKRTVALVGMMGAGKSTVGRRLAERLAVAFHDSDSEIEAAAGCTIPDIFDRYGETEFRVGERKVIARLLNEPPHVMATGGGALLDSETRARLASNSFSIWLKAPVELLMARVSRRDSRPLLQHGDPRQTIERLLNEREPLYSLADLVVEVGDMAHSLTVERILDGLVKRGIVLAP